MNLTSRTLDVYQKLRALPAEDLALPKVALGRKIGVSEAQLHVHIKALLEAGLIEKAKGGACNVSVLVVKDAKESDQNNQHSQPKEITNQSTNTTNPVNPKESQTSQPTQPTQVNRTLRVARPRKLTNQELVTSNKECSSLRSEQAAAQPDSTAEAEAKLPCLKLTLFQLQVQARSGQLDDKLRDQLQRLRKTKYKPWYEAAVAGLAERLKQQFIDRWNAHAGTRYHVTTRDEALWKQCAVNVLELGVTIERYLDVAWDVKPKSLKWPTPRYLASKFVVETVPAWVPPDERLSEADKELGKVMEESQQYLESRVMVGIDGDWVPIEPTNYPHRMWFDGNWPGLWGRQDNRDCAAVRRD
jgi:hypothetical protein